MNIELNWCYMNMIIVQQCESDSRPVGRQTNCCTKRCLEFEDNAVGRMTFSS